jgi:hypothetical protein
MLKCDLFKIYYIKMLNSALFGVRITNLQYFGTMPIWAQAKLLIIQRINISKPEALKAKKDIKY